MKPVIFAILTAICWSVGGFFEKRGLHMGNLSPVMGITIRTGVALLVLGIASFPHWSSLTQAGTKPLLYMVLGGGILAGSLGMLSFYTGISTGELSRVVPIAFGLSPVIGYFLGTFLLKEPSSIYKITGVLLVSLGVFLITGKVK